MNQCGGGEVVERKIWRTRDVMEWGLSLLFSSPKPEQDWYSFGVKNPFSDENRTCDPFYDTILRPLTSGSFLAESKAVVPGRDGDYRRVQVLGSLATCSPRLQ